MVQLQSLLGLIAIPVLAWALAGRGRRMAPAAAVRLALTGIALQVTIAALFLLVPGLRLVFEAAASAVAALQQASIAGARVVFGHLAGGPAPYEVTQPQNGFVLALQALPLILLVSVLSRVGYYFGILQRIVAGFAWALERTMGVTGPLATATAANIFVGMVEAPLMIRPYVAGLTRSGLFAMMTAGMATVAGTVMALYASLVGAVLPGAAGHILVASVISAPAALTIAWLMHPETESEAIPNAGKDIAADDDRPASVMDAITRGTTEGVKLLVNVAALLIVMVALVALANLVLKLAATPFGLDLTVERLAGWIAAPLAWLIGIPWNEAPAAGQLIGVKTVLNEFLAYLDLAGETGQHLSERSRIIMTYALCGFANFGSLGIMTGGLIAMAPARRADIVALGPWTLLSGTLATLMTGAVVGVMTP